MNDSLKAKLPYLVGATAGLFLGLPVMVQTVLILQALDFIGGLIVGGINENLSSRAALKGIARKGYALIILLGAAVLARGVGGQYDFDASVVVTVVSGAYSVYEMVSLLEKASLIGVPVPLWLTRRLAIIKRQFPLTTASEQDQSDDAPPATDTPEKPE